MGTVKNGIIWAGAAINGKIVQGIAKGGSIIYQAKEVISLEKYATTATGPTQWTSQTNATGSSSTTYATCSSGVTTAYTITLSGYDFSSLPSTATISKIEVNVMTRVGNATRGVLSGTLANGVSGDLTIVDTTTAHADLTTITGSFTRADVQALQVTVTNLRASSTYASYLYWAGVKIYYTV